MEAEKKSTYTTLIYTLLTIFFKHLNISRILLTKTSEKRIFQFTSHMGLSFGRTSIKTWLSFGANRAIKIRTSLHFGKGEENNSTFDKSTGRKFTFCSTRQKWIWGVKSMFLIAGEPFTPLQLFHHWISELYTAGWA